MTRSFLSRPFGRGAVSLLLTVLLCAGCTVTPEKARERLAKKQLPFTVETMRSAITKMDTEVVKLFLLAGMSPNELPNHPPDRPAPEDNLRIAIRSGNKEIVKALIDKGADLNYRNHMGETPIFSALVRDDPELVRLLVENGADLTATGNYDRTVTITAIQTGRVAALKLFLSRGIDVNSADATGATLLQHAAGSGHPEITRLLLEMGSEINRSDQNGVTPLLQAVITEHPENIRLLLAKGADVETVDSMGRTPLATAATRNRLDIMQLLLDKGASVNMDSLVKAAEIGHAEAVRLLLAKNRDALVPFATEALTRAAANGNSSVVATLLEHGVPVDSRDANNETAMDKAVRGGHEGTIKILRDHGADQSVIPEKSGAVPEMMKPARKVLRKFRAP